MTGKKYFLKTVLLIDLNLESRDLLS